jgi:phosphoenolpyruvate carboxylase
MSKPSHAFERIRLRQVALPEIDQPLRDDVNRLGALVGEVIAEQQGDAFFEQVERLRREAILRRESNQSPDALAAALAGRPQAEAEALVRAFSTWFGAVNLAERVHRIRRRRDYQKAGAAPQPGSLQAVLAGLRAEGVDEAVIDAMIARLRIEPVFTAHPTEAVRRVLLDKEREIVRCLTDDLDRNRTPQERSHDLARIRMALTSGWQTAESPPERPTVADEVEHVGYYLGETLYRVLPAFYETLELALGRPVPTRVLRFGTWVGGDMDGNPNVGADTMAAALGAQRRLAIAAYRRDLTRLSSLLSQSLERVAVDPAVLQRIEAYHTLLPKAATRISARHRTMPYRQLLQLIAARLAATARLDADAEQPGAAPTALAVVPAQSTAYAGVDEFRADLQLILASLLTHGGEHAGAFAVRRVLRRADAFGFHLATLDLRQDSRAHDDALAALLDDPDWPERDAAERATRLAALLHGNAPPAAADAADAQSVLDVFRARRHLRARHGEHAFGPYIVSMSRSAADALAVLALSSIAGEDSDTLDVAPLFETVDDLHAAPDVLRALFADPHYRDHLRRRDDTQVVMLGYSDSAKDAGLAASRWAIQRCQIELVELSRAAGITVRFFHGRGGSASRGGSKTERAVIAAPRGTVDGYLRLTEQGEVIHRKYAIRSLALRNLEQMTGAVLRASLRPRPPEPREVDWRGRMDRIAAESREVYRGLVHQHPDFVGYFRLATPIDVIERLKLGSRPAKRAAGGQAGVESLRAIPWVFAWSQNRATLTAWYGVGSALQAAIERDGLETMQEMARDWPFFATMVDDLEMVLAKSDLGIFEMYSKLAGELHEVLYPLVEAEFERACNAVLALRGSDTLLSGDRRLAFSMRLRNPYVDPISLLQVDLLQRWRAAGRQDDALFHALVVTVNGIAAGVQNTG